MVIINTEYIKTTDLHTLSRKFIYMYVNYISIKLLSKAYIYMYIKHLWVFFWGHRAKYIRLDQRASDSERTPNATFKIMLKKKM